MCHFMGKTTAISQLYFLEQPFDPHIGVPCPHIRERGLFYILLTQQSCEPWLPIHFSGIFLLTVASHVTRA